MVNRYREQQQQTLEGGASLTLVHSSNFTSLVASALKNHSPVVKSVGNVFSSKSFVRLHEIQTKKCPRGLGCRAIAPADYLAILRVNNWKAGIRRQQISIIERLNSLIRRHCERLPGEFACIGDLGIGKQHFQNAKLEDPDFVLPTGGRQKRVLILMSDTGGGHRASAEAIKATFELEFGNEYVVTIVDLWKEHTPWPFNQVPRTYNFLVKHETLWKFTFYGTRPRVIHQTNFAATSIFIAREVAKGLLKYKPDVIVSVHPLMQHIPLRILKTRGLLEKIPFTTVITDLNTCHPTWFHRMVTVCFCPTKEVAERAVKAGIKKCQIRVHGLPVRPPFCKPTRSKDELRKELGMEEELPAVLLMGGGEGMGPVEETARALGCSLTGFNSKPIGQLVVVCGNNKRLLTRLQTLHWTIPVQIRGFVSNMSDWMGACDCIITKAGPGTIAEAMIRGLPLLLNDFIAGQEVGNVPYVVENGAGKYCEDPKEIARTIALWFTTKSQEFMDMAQNALKLARPDAVFRIVHDLAHLATHKRVLPLVPIISL